MRQIKPHLATVSAKELNLLDKQDRLKHFRKYLYGEEL